jgi:hypothetical protein
MLQKTDAVGYGLGWCNSIYYLNQTYVKYALPTSGNNHILNLRHILTTF